MASRQTNTGMEKLYMDHIAQMYKISEMFKKNDALEGTPTKYIIIASENVKQSLIISQEGRREEQHRVAKILIDVVEILNERKVSAMALTITEWVEATRKRYVDPLVDVLLDAMADQMNSTKTCDEVQICNATDLVKELKILEWSYLPRSQIDKTTIIKYFYALVANNKEFGKKVHDPILNPIISTANNLMEQIISDVKAMDFMNDDRKSLANIMKSALVPDITTGLFSYLSHNLCDKMINSKSDNVKWVSFSDWFNGKGTRGLMSIRSKTIIRYRQELSESNFQGQGKFPMKIQNEAILSKKIAIFEKFYTHKPLTTGLIKMKNDDYKTRWNAPWKYELCNPFLEVKSMYFKGKAEVYTSTSVPNYQSSIIYNVAKLFSSVDVENKSLDIHNENNSRDNTTDNTIEKTTLSLDNGISEKKIADVINSASYHLLSVLESPIFTKDDIELLTDYQTTEISVAKKIIKMWTDNFIQTSINNRKTLGVLFGDQTMYFARCYEYSIASMSRFSFNMYTHHGTSRFVNMLGKDMNMDDKTNDNLRYFCKHIIGEEISEMLNEWCMMNECTQKIQHRANVKYRLLYDRTKQQMMKYLDPKNVQNRTILEGHALKSISFNYDIDMETILHGLAEHFLIDYNGLSHDPKETSKISALIVADVRVRERVDDEFGQHPRLAVFCEVFQEKVFEISMALFPMLLNILPMDEKGAQQSQGTVFPFAQMEYHGQLLVTLDNYIHETILPSILIKTGISFPKECCSDVLQFALHNKNDLPVRSKSYLDIGYGTMNTIDQQLLFSIKIDDDKEVIQVIESVNKTMLELSKTCKNILVTLNTKPELFKNSSVSEVNKQYIIAAENMSYIVDHWTSYHALKDKKKAQDMLSIYSGQKHEDPVTRIINKTRIVDREIVSTLYTISKKKFELVSEGKNLMKSAMEKIISGQIGAAISHISMNYQLYMSAAELITGKPMILLQDIVKYNDLEFLAMHTATFIFRYHKVIGSTTCKTTEDAMHRLVSIINRMKTLYNSNIYHRKKRMDDLIESYNTILEHIMSDESVMYTKSGQFPEVNGINKTNGGTVSDSFWNEIKRNFLINQSLRGDKLKKLNEIVEKDNIKGPEWRCALALALIRSEIDDTLEKTDLFYFWLAFLLPHMNHFDIPGKAYGQVPFIVGLDGSQLDRNSTAVILREGKILIARLKEMYKSLNIYNDLHNLQAVRSEIIGNTCYNSLEESDEIQEYMWINVPPNTYHPLMVQFAVNSLPVDLSMGTKSTIVNKEEVNNLRQLKTYLMNKFKAESYGKMKTIENFSQFKSFNR